MKQSWTHKLKSVSVLFQSKMAKIIGILVVLLILLLGAFILLSANISDNTVNQPALTIDISDQPPQGLSRDTEIEVQTTNEAPKMPRAGQAHITLVVTGLGLDETITNKAIDELPAGVTLAFSPYLDSEANYLSRASEKGHKILMEIPMQPSSFPDVDPGKLSLLTSNDWQENNARLDRLKMVYDDIDGFTNSFGNIYLSDGAQSDQFSTWLQTNDALFIENFLDSQNTMLQTQTDKKQVSYLSSNMQIDSFANTQSIVGRLRQLERTARSEGYAVGFAMPYPLTIEVIKKWADELDSRGVKLATPAQAFEKASEKVAAK